MASAFQCDRCKKLDTSFCNKCKITVECGFTSDLIEFDLCTECIKNWSSSRGYVAFILQGARKLALSTGEKK